MPAPAFTDSVTGAIEFTVLWEQDGIRHEEWYLGRKVNPVNDIFPRGMREALEGKRAGDSVTMDYAPRLCIPRHRESLVHRLPLDRLRKKTRSAQPIVPRVGRFYPQGHINGLLDVYPDTLTPFRLIDLDRDTFTADRNHPLASVHLTITATIQDLEQRDTGTYGALTHWRETICDWGPGMQTRHQGRPTDFFTPDFFDIPDPKSHSPSPPVMDKQARANLARLKERFLPADGATCVQGVEYMSDPVKRLTDLAGDLTPGSPVLIAFTDRFDESRAIRGWAGLHEFERMGLVHEYLRRAGLDSDAMTISMRNDWRDPDDPLFLETRGVSDSLFVVCGHKR